MWYLEQYCQAGVRFRRPIVVYAASAWRGENSGSQGLITHDFDEWFMISDDKEVIASLRKIPWLPQAPRHSQSFTFYRGIALLSLG